MANYLPPTEDLPIFDNSVFEINNTPLTFNDAQKGFLAFPYAQGNETFQDIIVDGTTYFANQVDNASIMPPPNNATTIVPTTAWVQDAITNAPANTDINVTTSATAGPYYMPMITGSTTGAYIGYIDSGMSYDATTNNLTTTTFTGDLVGNASTATSATSATTATTATTALACSGNSATATTSTNSNLININTTSAGTNYAIPLLDSAVLSGFKPLRVGGSITYNPNSNTLNAGALNGTSIISSPVVQASAGGIFRVMDTAGTISSTISNSNNIMVITPSNVGNNTFFVNTNNSPPVATGTTPTTYGGTNAGLGITWNTMSGTGATDFVNYAQGAGAGLGGFDFYSGSTSNPIAQIGFIPRVQSAYSTASNVIIPTYNWVNGTITAAIAALPGGGALLNGTNVFTAQNTFNNFAPQSPVVPTVNNSLTNKLYVDGAISGAISGAGAALLAGGTSLSNQIFTGYNTFSNLLTASAGFSSIGGRNYGYTTGSNWMYIEATANVLLNGGLNYFRPNSLYILEGDLTQFITTNYASGGYFRVVNTGVYTIAVQFSITNLASANLASIALYYGAIPSGATSLNRNINYNSTPTNMYGSGTWTIQLTAGIDYGFLSSINSTPFNTTGTYSMSVIRIM